MTFTNLYKTGLSVGLLALSLAACQEPALDQTQPAVSVPAQLDPTGGTWRTVLLKSAGYIPVPAPAAVSSAAYQAELADLKTLVAQADGEQQKAATYWASGGVLRWNQLARLLVAKYNVAPIVGSAFDPTTPFANPPFAARAYALLSVAQYDALVTVWKAKQQYNRPSPAKQGVSTRVPVADLPSYPSEDAAVAEASCQVLAFLFPKEAEWLKARAAEHKNSRLWAGAAVRSDLSGGESVGATVATRVIAYAKTDRMAAARDVNNTWKTVEAYDAGANWKSLESPSRAPMLPLFGKVKTWYDSVAIFRYIPGPPPKADSPAFRADIANVRRISDNRTREQWRIAEYWNDGAGTYTPPGHWNAIAEDLIRKASLNELRTARALALMNRAIMDAGVACWHTKFKYFTARPTQVDPNITSSTGIPNFPAYTSGHSTFSAAGATVLGYLFPTEAARLMAQAEEAGMSRIYGGIHYMFDNLEGRRCGQGVGNVAISWAKTDGAN